MKRLLWLLLAMFVSPEFLVAVILYSLYFFLPSVLNVLGHHLKGDKEVWKYLPILPGALAAYTFNMSAKIRAPSKEELNQVLYGWPLYQLVVDRVYVGIFYSVVCFILSLLLWMLGESLGDSIIALFFLEATVVSGVSALTMHEAAQKLIEILVKHSTLK
ncbi:hypothetical protein [Dyella nitratireducens]|uniref:Uncharacterized protein n=1 Tax=Dyella nitratireducens TaxID=1849580 RepID=A0ABQ1FQG3_9GAMM|nr:hypothetical protein [Dyella nitratireducens]GGA24979.1 hypothetical protein GCM10010981_11830 [Dyella nitratireducens]GLQ43755.1 hypothetical protein GCM10007902_36050 [Dyella nitratireducens]